MQTKNGFTLLNVSEFINWLNVQNVTRSITRIQVHHTWSPDYSNWNKKPDAFHWQSSMKSSHSSRNFSDIAQHFTILPDGSVITGRSLNKAPAGITGANTGAICIENLGNFDTDGDIMNEEQADSIVIVIGELLKRFNLAVDNITYHAWWAGDGTFLGDYDKNKSAKTCPGTAFFGGNTKSAFEKNLKVRIHSYLGREELTMSQYEEIMKKLAQHDEIINLVGQDIQTVNKRVDGVESENVRQNEILNLVGQDIQNLNEKVGI